MDGSSGPKRKEARTFWSEAVRLWAESGLPVREFCRREGLSEPSFYSWRVKLRPQTAAFEVRRKSSADGDATAPKDRPSAVEFIPVRVRAEEDSVAGPTPGKTAAEAASIEVARGSAWRVRVPVGFDPPTLDAVLTVLERRSC